MKLKVAVVGVGNCFSALYQGIEYYKKKGNKAQGVIAQRIGKYDVKDIVFTAAFDVSEKKVGKPLNEAIMAEPNLVSWIKCPKSNTIVSPSPVLDGIGKYVSDVVKTSCKKITKADVLRVLEDSQAEVLINFLPVGSDKATQFWANVVLEAGIPMVNCIPSFIASDPSWALKFKKKKVAIIGDDIKSAFGSTIVHRVIAKLVDDRGLSLESTYQLNFGGNTDFLNMLERERLKSKKISKTEAVKSQVSKIQDVHIGPSDYIPFLKNTKIAFMNIKGRGWADVPFELDMKLTVDDKSNSGPIAADTLRIAKTAQDHGLYGSLEVPSAYYMKHPIRQMSDPDARRELIELIKKW